MYIYVCMYVARVLCDYSKGQLLHGWERVDPAADGHLALLANECHLKIYQQEPI